VRAFEIKLSQGAKPGKGGVLPAAKVTAEIAASAASRKGLDSLSRRTAIRRSPTCRQLLDMVLRVRERDRQAGRHQDGDRRLAVHERTVPRPCAARHRRRAGFHRVDGGEGGSGAAPQALADHMALSIEEACRAWSMP
jgi:glutamate synthase domain-containing protein 2